VHQLQPRAAGGQLAVRPVDAGPRLKQRHDCRVLELEQAVHRAAATRQIREPPSVRPIAPGSSPVRIEPEQ